MANIITSKPSRKIVMLDLAIPCIALVAGCFFLFRNLKMIAIEAALHAYLDKSVKASVWIEKLGKPKVFQICRFFLMPLGALMSLGLVVISLRSIWITLIG